jgi:hypothetical protein
MFLRLLETALICREVYERLPLQFEDSFDLIDNWRVLNVRLKKAYIRFVCLSLRTISQFLRNIFLLMQS